MKTLITRCLVLVGLLFWGNSALAALIINIDNDGGNTKFEFSGSIDLTGATLSGYSGGYGLGFISGGNNWYIAFGSGTGVVGYEFISFDGPFGNNLTYFNTPSSMSGDNLVIWGESGGTEQLMLSSDYTSGALISGMMTFGGMYQSYGILNGTYNYAVPNDQVIVRVGQGFSTANVSEPLAAVLLVLGALGLARSRRK